MNSLRQYIRLDPRLAFGVAGALLVLLLFHLSDALHGTDIQPAVTVPGDTPGFQQYGPSSDSEHDGEDGWYPAELNTWTNTLSDEDNAASQENMRIEHVELQSQMTRDGKRFIVDFVDEGSFNPSILPHPYKADTWFMIAQRDKSNDDNDIWNTEIFCEAQYHPGTRTMRCTHSPATLPIASTITEECTGTLAPMNDVIGPHDARIFYGPDRPYIIYGSQSKHSCLGQWMQDLRRLTPWTNRTQRGVTKPDDPFFFATDLQRPPPFGKLEKNWFVFWDTNNEPYVHHDITDKHRVFSKLSADGTVSEDLAPYATSDAQCMSRLMPKLHQNGKEHIHQATNSLSITLCKRSDPDCERRSDNTFNFVLFQSKSFYNHGVYEPYMMLFRREAPFEVYGISSLPFWYNGRGKIGELWRWSTWKPNDQTQMIFTTQMAWNRQGAMYHGFLDDEVIISFGIEDKHGGGIDVVAGDLLQGMTFCHQV